MEEESLEWELTLFVETGRGKSKTKAEAKKTEKSRLKEKVELDWEIVLRLFKSSWAMSICNSNKCNSVLLFIIIQ